MGQWPIDCDCKDVCLCPFAAGTQPRTLSPGRESDGSLWPVGPVERIARVLHEAHMPWCDYTYPFEDPMSGRKVYETLARAVLAELAKK